jgi:hypothetical protein
MTVYDKFGNRTDPHSILPGTQLGVSLLIRMPNQPQPPASYADDEPPLPDLSIGVLDLVIPNETDRGPDEKWGSQDEKGFRKESREVQHLEYR